MKIKIHEAQIGDISNLAKVHVETWKNTYQGIVSKTILEGLSCEWSERNFKTVLEKERERARCFVAEGLSGIIIGFAIGGLERSDNLRFKGELWGIYISKEFQRSGVGKNLVSAVVDYLIALKINSMLVWVLKENPYRKFYETLRGKYLGERPIKMGREEYLEVAYGWDDLGKFFLEVTSRETKEKKT